MLRPFVAAPTLVVLLILAGCSDPEPKEPRATASATPTVAAPTMPAQAKENSPEGAAAFVKHYIDVFNYASNTGDVAGLRRLSSSCKPCERYATEFEAIYKRGDRISAHLWTLRKLDGEVDSQGTHVLAGVDVDEGSSVNRFRFLFDLPTKPPLKVLNITILEGS